MLLVNNISSPIIASDKLLRITLELYLPKPYFWLRPGENVLLDSVLGVRRWTDEIRALLFLNQFNKYIPIGSTQYGNYAILDKTYTETGLIKSFDSNLNSSEFTNIIITKFINKNWRGSTQEYSIPIMNRQTITESGGKITTRGWNIYAINSAIGQQNFYWEFWTGRGFEANGFTIARGDLVHWNSWEILGCRRDALTTAIFQNGILKQSRVSPYSVNSSVNWQFAGNELFSNLYFNYALSDSEIYHWSRYLKILYADLFSN